MAIRKYGLDEAEIEHLRAANCTDEEINDLNRKRVQEQMEEDNPTGGEEDDATPPTVEENEDFKRIRAVMPDIHPAYIGFIVSSPYSEIYKGTPDDQLKNLYDGLKHKGPDGKSELERINASLKEAFNAVTFNPKDIDADIYDFSEDNKELLLDETERLSELNTPAAEAESDKYFALLSALDFAENFLPVDRKMRDAVIARRSAR